MKTIDGYDRRMIESVLSTDKEIIIISGEGERGNCERYYGKRTVRAVLSRLTRERCSGDRWSKCVYLPEGCSGVVDLIGKDDRW